RAAAKARRVIDILQNGGGSGRPENQSRPSKVGCFDIAEKASAGQSAMLMHLLPGELWTTCGGSVDTRIQCALRPRKSRLRVPFLALTRITCLSGPSPVVPRIWDITLARPPEASIQGRPRPRRHRGASPRRSGAALSCRIEPRAARGGRDARRSGAG